MTSQNHVKRLEIQSHQRRDLCLYPARNGGPKTGSGGGRHHPPTLLGLRTRFFCFFFNELMSLQEKHFLICDFCL